MITVVAPDGVPEVRAGDDLAALLLGALDEPLADGDVVVVTSKVVSKAEGRVAQGDREQWIDAETERTVAVRGRTRIVRNRLGLTMAAAGVDASNVPNGSVVLLPLDPDVSARTLRAAVRERGGANVGVIVTDTAGRTWREGQTDLAIGAAGVVVLESYAGRVDEHGNELAVTAPALADEIASAAELAQGKLAGRPFAVLRGRPDLVLPAGEDGPGAAVLVRAEGADLFGYGAREAVVRAVAAAAGDQVPFGSVATVDEMVDAFGRAGVPAVAAEGVVRCPADRAAVAAVLAFAHGWTVEPEAADGADPRTDLRIRPMTP
ncbi:coenzyme F420-0:L-glutamate ligase [Nocardioides panacisoli]|uniref:Coenzyme F420:L-glutamate ligase-like domain-containing protein n=1 Tax=Nocardioides panacisoli TaxID=627624 RepID=A0ABP7HZ61_9ACTN